MSNFTSDSPIGTTSAREIDAPSSGPSGARGTVDDLAGKAKEKAREAASRQKTRATGELSALAGALHEAASTLERDGHPSSRILHMAADRVDQIGSTFESRDVDSIFREARGFARRNPAAFLGGAVALGFLASRFLKASGDDLESHVESSESDFERDPFPESSGNPYQPSGMDRGGGYGI